MSILVPGFPAFLTGSELRADQEQHGTLEDAKQPKVAKSKLEGAPSFALGLLEYKPP